MKYVVDRIEGNYAVCEDENNKIVNIPLKELPEGIKEKDVISFEEDKISKILIQDTLERKKKIEEMVKDLWEN